MVGSRVCRTSRKRRPGALTQASVSQRGKKKGPASRSRCGLISAGCELSTPLEDVAREWGVKRVCRGGERKEGRGHAGNHALEGAGPRAPENPGCSVSNAFGLAAVLLALGCSTLRGGLWRRVRRWGSGCPQQGSWILREKPGAQLLSHTWVGCEIHTYI